MIVTEVGAGTIGVSWTTLLAARGHDVVVTDPRPDLVEVVDTGVRQFAPSLGADPDEVLRRVRSALFREAAHLVRTGVVDAEELDRVVTGALGPRWATGGPFLSFHLGGGPGGLRHMLAHLGPGMSRRWRDLGDPTLDDETVD